MNASRLATIEHSDPVVTAHIHNLAETGWEGVTAASLAGELAVPSRIFDARGLATRLIVIAGGAASGKTTLAAEISSEMTKAGTRSAVISTDDFVRGNRDDRRKWEAAGMRPADKYDFVAMRRAIGAICANQDPDHKVHVPKYDSRTGLAVDSEARIQIPRVDVLMVEGDMLGEQGATPQDLYPKWAYSPFTMYVHASDVERLRRRVTRDMQERSGHGETPQIIIDSFEHRQYAQHLPHTLPYSSSANAIVMPEADTASGPPVYDMYTF